ncbi:MAG: thiamine/thiamine pyrophosphate ABC transporter permease, partial [Pseudomonadota bacterium]|nr:thiamine/thiamine pyrophosphate ABC transporter permease [Pseudomonadota bacterium]
MGGVLALLAVAAAVGAALLGLAGEAGALQPLEVLRDPYILRVVRFTLWQAVLSTLLSVGLAIPLARALARRGQFPGRAALLQLASLSLVIPTMVAVFGIVAIHGRSGWVNQLLEGMGFDGRYYLYGLTGILLAHLFFNLPLAARIFLQGLQGLPPETWRLASHFGMRSGHIFRHIEWPLLRTLIPGAAGIIFMLCFTSFAIVLTLGGGPRASTLEVAIYQAIRFDFDLARAVALSLIQLALCLGLAALISRFSAPFGLQFSDSGPLPRPDRRQPGALLVDTAVILAAALFLLAPLLAVGAAAVSPGVGDTFNSAAFRHSLTTSILIALAAGLLAIGLALPVAALVTRLRLDRDANTLAGLAETFSLLALVVPPITLGTGLFLVLRSHADIFSVGVYLVIIVNALMALPFAVRILAPPLTQVARHSDRLCDSLGVRGWHRWRHIYLPNLRRPLGFALALAATLSAGDMGVIALFGTQDLTTLPL